MYILKRRKEKQLLEQISIDRSSLSLFSIDNIHQFIHIEDASNSIVGVLPFVKSIYMLE